MPPPNTNGRSREVSQLSKTECICSCMERMFEARGWQPHEGLDFTPSLKSLFASNREVWWCVGPSGRVLGRYMDWTVHFASVLGTALSMVMDGRDSASGSAIVQVVARAPVTRRPRVQSPSCAGEACGDLLLALQHWKLCLSRIAWPRKWRSRLTDVGWDVKEPLRTSFPAVTTLSVHIHLKYTLHIHAGRHGAVTMACDFELKDLGYGSRLPLCGAVSLGKTLHLYAHSLDPGVNGYLFGQWLFVCLNITWLKTTTSFLH